MEEIEKLRKENKKLKTSNKVMMFFIILFIIIQLVDNHFFGLF